MGSSDFLGTGWNFDFTYSGDPALGMNGLGLDADGCTAVSSDDENIRQSIWLILGTAPGERMGRPDFGCGIHDLVFSTQSAGAIGDVTAAVEQALVQWEPRIDVLGVDASADANTPSALVIEIHYVVRATNSRFNLVYPFYLST